MGFLYTYTLGPILLGDTVFGPGRLRLIEI
jgi:hypothetical protein